MVVYDYKWPTLATKLYYHYLKNQKLGNLPEGCKFSVINFVDVEYSRRVNPIQQKYINKPCCCLGDGRDPVGIAAKGQEGRRWRQ